MSCHSSPPAMAGDRHGKQLQDIDMISAEGGGGGGGARRVKPFQTEHRAKPHPTRVGSKPECRRGGGKKARPFLLEVHPPRDVRAGRRGEADVLRRGRDRHRYIDKPPEENAAPTDHLAREGKHSDQRQQLPRGAFLPRPPRGQAIGKPCTFVRREAHLLKRGVQGDAQELEAACRQDQLLRREGGTEVAAEVLESLQVAGARSMGGPRQKIINQVMEDAAATANVYGNPVKRLRELSKNEGGRAGPKREPEVDVYPQKRPIRGPHRAEAEDVADVRFRHIRVPPQAAHNGHGRIHGGIPYRKLLSGNARINRGPSRRGQIQTQAHGAVGHPDRVLAGSPHPTLPLPDPTA